MIETLDEQLLDTTYIEAISMGQTLSNGSSIRPAESNWHMVVVKEKGQARLIFVGPLTSSGSVSWEAEAEIIWIRFKHGTFMPHMPLKGFLDLETVLPEANSHAFWLKSSAWQFPSYENVDTFVERLVRAEILVHDPLIDAVLRNEPVGFSPRTVRHRFLQATGMTQNQLYQIQRAQQAAFLLQQGLPILDTVHDLGYFDQPHLTKALKQWVGYTPKQLLHTSESCHFLQDPSLWPSYTSNSLSENEPGNGEIAR